MMEAWDENMSALVYGIGALSFTGSRDSPVNDNCSRHHIHRLPVELLRHIFLLSVNDIYPSIFSFGNMTISANFAEPPLVFTRVCRLWRVVALSTAGVWSRIQVALPGGVEKLQQFLSSLLRFWLARSGSLPLTLRIVPPPPRTKSRCTFAASAANAQVLEILISEAGRWEMASVMPTTLTFARKDIDAPRLRTLECYWTDLSKLNAPNLCHLHISHQHHLSTAILFTDTDTYKHMRHLHLQVASGQVIHTSLIIFHHLETIVADIGSSDIGTPRDSITHHYLETMTLPLYANPLYRRGFIDIFNGLNLPKLQKLTVAAKPKGPEVKCIMAVLTAASCHLRVLDFQTEIPLSEVDVNEVEPLFSAVREVTVRGEVLRRPATDPPS
ncbi:hypothetical protein DEU56DRAFT_828571 [Suillus clintonianus]|uniref:uncharacterized protein n=1 Tax=Suillus clintonianus TaxID=1904413 RepID=UPI001B879DFC|nr:uncharacterized protein DEU56DRAFT_828571 [Suillus clintonianus]KAG2124019.1 hypothetical protein DEU56DRAFT_828571 [Suillus clintonianus]